MVKRCDYWNAGLWSRACSFEKGMLLRNMQLRLRKELSVNIKVLPNIGMHRTRFATPQGLPLVYKGNAWQMPITIGGKVSIAQLSVAVALISGL